MKRSEFQIAVETEFGAGYAGALLRDLTMEALGGRTAREALAAGVPPREVWLALCEATDVPVERRHGVGQREPGRDR
ncbi:DUF3046 domain-containing protein [Agromyces sp. CFH 90414]|uniref:DUF3046 domain-containing protein n=1 Tax=Agromyces agglutinans TaxID=2662258 RepID=A0A6I2FG32_9MICO|nr:DUF3046 domain-containing protein [Agromyces agglutinans]MRG61630.1 DUF3046 domain-containing protein [Agromyces agglutinans]